MNLKQLEYFVSVAELGSFSKAALILNIAQPALTSTFFLAVSAHRPISPLLRPAVGVVKELVTFGPDRLSRRVYQRAIGT